MSEASISINRDQINKLLGTLKLLEASCTDCEIVGGRIRQKTNDRHSIFDIDLTSVLGDSDIVFSMIKQKIGSLKAFELDDNVTLEDENIVIETTENEHIFTDAMSKIRFRKPVRKFLDNTFITEEKFNQSVNYSEDNLIFSTTVSTYISKRIKNLALALNNETIQCDLNNFTASLKIETVNKENDAIVMNAIALNRQIPERNFKMVYLPFALDINSDVQFSTYQTRDEVLLCKFEQKFYGIPVNIYTQVKLCQ